MNAFYLLPCKVQQLCLNSQRGSLTTVNGLCTRAVEEKPRVFCENPKCRNSETSWFKKKKKGNKKCVAGDCYFIFYVNPASSV